MPARRLRRSGYVIRVIAALSLLLHCVAAKSEGIDRDGAGSAPDRAGATKVHPAEFALFDLHDPGLMDSWAAFLETTPMLNGALVPPALQNRLVNTVATYQWLTPNDRPVFFVATYFDLLSERLLSDAFDGDRDIVPMRVCPVFVSDADASVSKLLALASGLPEALFVHAAGKPERYRYLFLQTELSHCNFLATAFTAYERRQWVQTEGQAAASFAELSFDVGEFSYTAMLSTKKEFRALLETVGDADAITAFKKEITSQDSVDETEILMFARLLSLLATDGKSGYAAIPVLLPQFSRSMDDGLDAPAGSFRVADALTLAYRAREVFGRLVPFAILDTRDLVNARSAVVSALADGADYELNDTHLIALMERFVAGSELLLAANPENERMPLSY